MADPAKPFLARIRAIAPELAIESAVYNGDGLVNDVVVVNDHLVFRFAKSSNPYSRAALAAELRVLSAIRPHISLPIPNPFYASADAIAYERLPGETLSLEMLLGLAPTAQQVIAEQLGGFLRAMHSVPVDAYLPRTQAPARYADWIDLRGRFETALTPLLMNHQKAWMQNLFDAMLADERQFDYEPRLIHGDLGPYHILCNPAAGRLTAIIDFGTGGLGDPATDLGGMLQIYGERFVQRLMVAYPEARALLPRARFYAQALELQWAMLGVTRAELFWFTAHLGGARDLWADEHGV